MSSSTYGNVPSSSFGKAKTFDYQCICEMGASPSYKCLVLMTKYMYFDFDFDFDKLYDIDVGE